LSCKNHSYHLHNNVTAQLLSLSADISTRSYSSEHRLNKLLNCTNGTQGELADWSSFNRNFRKSDYRYIKLITVKVCALNIYSGQKFKHIMFGDINYDLCKSRGPFASGQRQIALYLHLPLSHLPLLFPPCPLSLLFSFLSSVLWLQLGHGVVLRLPQCIRVDPCHQKCILDAF